MLKFHKGSLSLLFFIFATFFEKSYEKYRSLECFISDEYYKAITRWLPKW